MSYSKRGEDCDVFVFSCTRNSIVCGTCLLQEKGDWETPFTIDPRITHLKVLEHLEEHQRNGHKVPGFLLRDFAIGTTDWNFTREYEYPNEDGTVPHFSAGWNRF